MVDHFSRCVSKYFLWCFEISLSKRGKLVLAESIKYRVLTSHCLKKDLVTVGPSYQDRQENVKLFNGEYFEIKIATFDQNLECLHYNRKYCTIQ